MRDPYDAHTGLDECPSEAPKPRCDLCGKRECARYHGFPRCTVSSYTDAVDADMSLGDTLRAVGLWPQKRDCGVGLVVLRADESVAFAGPESEVWAWLRAQRLREVMRP